MFEHYDTTEVAKLFSLFLTMNSFDRSADVGRQGLEPCDQIAS